MQTLTQNIEPVANSRAKLAFTKMHALGNDFVVLDGHQSLPALTPELLRAIADRRQGVGCDQILIVDPAPRSGVDFGYRIYNADGSQVGQCGNGVRCLALFVARRGLSDKSQLKIATATTEMTVELCDGDQVRAQMAVPDFRPEALPLRKAEADSYDIEGVACFAVSMGNPHLVVTVPHVASADVEGIGARLATHPDLPEGANVGFAEVVSTREIRLRVYERGAGETPACGSGACGAVAALVRAGVLDAGKPVTVHLPGGNLTIEWAGGGHPLWMTGPATWVYEGLYSL